MPGVVSLKGYLLIIGALVLCIGMAALLTSALAGSDENGTVDAPGEKPAVNKVPITPAESPAPEEAEDKAVEEREPRSLATGETTSPPGEAPETTEPTAALTSSPAATTRSEFTGVVLTNTNETDGSETEEVPSANATASPEPAATSTAYVDYSSDEEAEETVATPTLERYAPPRPSATMAKAHQSGDRPLVQSGHQIVNPSSSSTPGGNEIGTASASVEPDNGLLIKGVGVLLDRTPENVALTRSGVEIANLDWLLDPAMRLGGRHPRVAFEGETFTVTVTVEARNLTVTGVDPAYVVLVPPPDETGVYEITRVREPRGLLDGERGVWEFSVATRTGRLTLANLTLPEERLVTNLTSNPDVFAFRAYAFAGSQEIISTGVSDPILAIRPDGSAGMAEASSLPELYALAGIQDSMLRPTETMAGAWARGADHDTIVAGAVGHLEALSDLGKEEIAAVYDLEGGDEGGEQSATSSSIVDQIMEFFGGLFG
ncbi:hypothetical protein [Methanoculleus oceani]|uniref:DUF4384 domain-containing protein n=1 Tax=Methanoculleus oceani TaxID=2184756 RepID=A0ABD4TBW6_9EURY|nr:hypothetical protein [Methanoculleus sp. CWC-02]MCM2465308.1 hypothetical protein [Methanoculleus sp. CWC-02]